MINIFSFNSIYKYRNLNNKTLQFSCRLTKNWIILSSVLNSGPIFPTRQKIWRKREVNMTWETINQYFVIILLFGDYFNCHIVTITVTLEWKSSSCLPWKYKSFTLFCIQIFKKDFLIQNILLPLLFRLNLILLRNSNFKWKQRMNHTLLYYYEILLTLLDKGFMKASKLFLCLLV